MNASYVPLDHYSGESLSSVSETPAACSRGDDPGTRRQPPSIPTAPGDDVLDVLDPRDVLGREALDRRLDADAEPAA
jgi:hypothetical protein